MFPPRFDYRRAESVEEALDLRDAHDDAAFLAGGHSLIPDLKKGEADPGVVIDLGGIDALRGIVPGESETRIGALATYADLLDSAHLREETPVLTEAVAELGDRQIRNRGTIGGNLAYADPGADLPAAAIVADATLETRHPGGSREVPAEECFVDGRETALGANELVTAVRVRHREGTYVKKTHPATGYALVGVAASVERADGEVVAARVAANGALDHAVRLNAVEEELVGTAGTPKDRERAADRASDGFAAADFRSDPYASGEFRAHLLSTYVEEALANALDAESG